MTAHRGVSVAPRVPTWSELAVLAAAVVIVLVWTVSIVISVDNVRDRHNPDDQITPATVAPAVTYQAQPADG